MALLLDASVVVDVLDVVHSVVSAAWVVVVVTVVLLLNVVDLTLCLRVTFLTDVSAIWL